MFVFISSFVCSFVCARRARGALLSLALAVCPLVCGGTPGEVPIGGVLHDAMLQGLNGPSRRLGEYRGRPLLINVWASWCGPCIEEMASLERLAWREDRVAFSLIGISTDDYPDKALGFLNRSNATIRHFIDHDRQMENMLGASTIPLTVLVDAKGRVVDKIYGARQWDSAESMRIIARAFGSGETTSARGRNSPLAGRERAAITRSASSAPGTSGSEPH
jgi:thiol-disulfide isomerase/thioredoxin